MTRTLNAGRGEGGGDVMEREKRSEVCKDDKSSNTSSSFNRLYATRHSLPPLIILQTNKRNTVHCHSYSLRSLFRQT
jgi:hypothetical protein